MNPADAAPAVFDETRLNEEQLRVVRESDGPCLVIAGAGSGKTRAVVHRVAWLLEHGARPDGILLLSFTNKAAREMLERIEGMLGERPANMMAGTFHHAANRLLRRNAAAAGISPDYAILDEEDSAGLIAAAVKKLSVPDDFPSPAKIRAILSLSVNTVSTVRDVVSINMPALSPFIHTMETISTEYQKRKRALNVLDYDDLLVCWLRLMRNNETGAAIAGSFRHVIVDEYHDTNRLQALILYQVARAHRNILVVGDDAQSIYSFRGATVGNILEFPKIYPDAKVFHLSINYRSTPEILRLANNVISRNRRQFPRKLVTSRTTGVKPLVVQCLDAHDQAAYVARRIADLVREGARPADIGILFRSRYQSPELEVEIRRRGLPYALRGGPRFFEQAHVKDVLAYLRAADNVRDEIAWRRVFARCEGVGEKTADRLVELLADCDGAAALAAGLSRIKVGSRAAASLKPVLATIEAIAADPDAGRGIDAVLEAAGYRAYVEKTFMDDEERLEELETVKRMAATYGSLHDFLVDAALQEQFRGENRAGGGALTLSTIHQAKGLEWRIVFVIGVNGNHFPHASAHQDMLALEEERRIFYVAVTRAREDLTITCHLRDVHRGQAPPRKSLFLEEMDPTVYDSWRA